MTILAWSVRARGGDPQAIRDAVSDATAVLRGDARVLTLSPDEQDYWREDVLDVSFGRVNEFEGEQFLLVELELGDLGYDEARTRTEKVLCGGFDTAVLDAVMAVEGVTEATYDSLGEPPF